MFLPMPPSWPAQDGILDFIHWIPTIYDSFLMLDTMVIMNKGNPVFYYVL